jgi:hypothetical protein
MVKYARKPGNVQEVSRAINMKQFITPVQHISNAKEMSEKDHEA